MRWIALPYIFFSLIATKMENYVMQAAPAVALIVAAVAVELWRLRKPLPLVQMLRMPMRALAIYAGAAIQIGWREGPWSMPG